MKTSQKIILGTLVLLAVVALGAIFYTHSWADYHLRLRALWQASNHPSTIVDTHALDTAQQLEPLAITRLEKNYAQEALRLADHSVDLAFAAALQDATENPAPLTPETRDLTGRIKQTEILVAADQDRIDQLKKQLAVARTSAKDALQSQIDLAQAQLALDQDALDDAHDDLIRAGGDRHATIQQLLDQHEASMAHKEDGGAAAAANAAAVAVETTQSSSILAQTKALLSLRAKQILVQTARQDALQRAANLSAQHDELEKRLAQEKSEKRIIRKAAKAGSAANPGVAAHSSAVSQQAQPPQALAQPPTPPAATSAPPNASPDTQSQIALVTHLTSDQKSLTALDKRIQDEEQLAATYATWLTLITTRQEAFLHGLFKSVFWIIFIALCVFLANEWVRKFFSNIAAEHREAHTAQALLLLGVQILGVILILLVIFGVPQNFGTVAALAGAGLTVALKDFIMGFIGWFVLMGKDGIRPGDWVEINGVTGEVLDVGLLHTMLLETGNWSDAAHPTGRKVSFNNSFAIEGHYFNFSAKGQWLWDEIDALVPPSSDPVKIADAIQKLAVEATAENGQIALEEWHRAASSYSQGNFTAEPSVIIRPTAEGINISVRYLARVNQRAELRQRLYRSIVDMLRGKVELEEVAGPPRSGKKS